MSRTPKDTRPKVSGAWSPFRFLGKHLPKPAGSDFDKLDFTPDFEGEARFYEQLGRAISEWQKVESALADLFVVVEGSQNRRKSAAIFHAAGGITSKIDLLQAAIDFDVADEGAYIEWKQIKARVLASKRKRNDLAHLKKMAVGPSEPGQKTFLILMEDLENPNVYLRGSEGSPAVTYDADDIANCVGEFGVIAREIALYAKKLAERAPPSESP